jgi:CRP-like cAMP-binding protein
MNFIPVSAAQIQDTMARLSYFDGWEKDQLARLASSAKQFPLAKKEKLVSKGALIDALYVVVSGQIRLYIPLSNQSERVISLVDKGQSFGESCLIRAEPCPYDAVAGKDSHILAIDALVYRRELRASPVLAEHTLNLLAQHLLHTLRDIEICAQPSSLQKVALYLVHLKPAGAAHELDIRLPALKRDIAAKLGLSQETFSRMLAFMAQQGFIQLSGSHIRVDDWVRLHGLASAGCPMEVPGRN